MQYAITNHRSGNVQFTAEIDCAAGTPERVKRGLAVLRALKDNAYLSEADLSEADLSGAYLREANLSGAYLSGAYLSGAYLREANLSGAYLRKAYLRDANLSGAYLRKADLSRADLSWADLSRAYLREADLSGANLSGAYLSGADISEAYLSGADLSGANLSGAKWRGDVTIQRAPLFVSGLTWPVVILDRHMQIGCELHSLTEWAAFDDRSIAAMAGKEGLSFWRSHKEALLALARGDNRGADKPAEVAT